MRNTKKLILTLLAATALTWLFTAFSVSNAASDLAANNDIVPVTSIPSLTDTIPTPTPTSALLSGCAFVSDNTYQSAILNCKIPDAFKGKKFAVFYEYWTSDAPDKITKTNIYRTYNTDNFSSVDSYELFNVEYNAKYSFRAAIIDLNSQNSQTIYSDVVTFSSVPPPTAGLFKRRIYGYVAPEFKASSEIDRSGFKVSINGGAATATTDSEGYFSFSTSSSNKVFYNIKISRPGYIERSIDLGYITGTVNASQNGAYTIMLCGDINNDKAVNMSDVVQIAKTFNLSMGSEGFIGAADFNRDNVVNMNDIVLAAKNFNKSENDYAVYPKIPYIELKSPSETIYLSYNRTPIFDINGYYLKNIASYSFKLNYRYTAQIIGKELTGSPSDNLLANLQYDPVIETNNDTGQKILSVNKSYTKLADYKNSGAGEESGRLISIQSVIPFVNSATGSDIFQFTEFTCKDWDNNTIKVEILKPRFVVTSITP
ncbi:MAG TPA: dockerin type I domain-containing protein [Pseudobacteroides sp.]|uniref:dockerin type I domain-containing protein n=1 Tax=Pseudobacteroides sp. TaxID=1968840 RepID=UPI002F9400FA